MNEQQVRAIFLLADIPVVSLTKVENGYWPDCEEYKELRVLNPWWLVDTGRGEIEIGDRKKVVNIEWCNTGVVFPFIDQNGEDNVTDKHFIRDINVTKWNTGCHAWGYGQTVTALTNLKRCFGRHDFLKGHWDKNPPKEEDKKNWLIVARRAHWVTDGEDRIEVTISAVNETFALQEFYTQYPKHRVTIIDDKKHHSAERVRLTMKG